MVRVYTGKAEQEGFLLGVMAPVHQRDEVVVYIDGDEETIPPPGTNGSAKSDDQRTTEGYFRDSCQPRSHIHRFYCAPIYRPYHLGWCSACNDTRFTARCVLLVVEHIIS